MEDMLAGYPFWAVWLFLYFGATMRGQGTYWIGRGVLSGARRARQARGGSETVAVEPAATRWSSGRRVIARIGLVAIPLGYLTVGLQSAIIAAAGLIGIPWGRFTLVQIPGALAWATIYSTIGFAAWVSVARAISGEWWPVAVLVVVILAIIAAVVYWRRRRRSEAATPTNVDDVAADVIESPPVEAAVAPVAEQRKAL